MANKFIILLDMDSTVYDLLTPTLAYVNRRYGMNLTPSDIKEWRWDKAYNVRPWDFWNKQGTYSGLTPFPYSVEAIKEVHDMGVRQVFLSSANFKYATEKFNAVDRDFPFIGSKDVLLTGGNKDLVSGDVLVDDGPHNLDQFEGFKILADMHRAPYCRYPNSTDTMLDWREYPGIIKNLMFKKYGWQENVG